MVVLPVDFLGAGDSLIAHTDGLIPDAMARQAEPSTLLRDWCTAVPPDIRRDADEFGQRLLADIRACGDEWTDDATLLVITRPAPAQAG